MQLNAARKRQSAVFESKTMRDSFMSDVIRKLEEPGIHYSVHYDMDDINNEIVGDSDSDYVDENDDINGIIIMAMMIVKIFLFDTIIMMLGPGQYNIPSVIQPKSVPAERQNFSFTGDRFKDVRTILYMICYAAIHDIIYT